MRVLIACEFSGIVRDAFAAMGHDAWSCDLLESEKPGQHLWCDVFDAIAFHGHWDMMIFHWPCTRMCNSGVRWLFGGRGNNRDNARWGQMESDAQSFSNLLHHPDIERVCGENPIPHKYARQFMGRYTQIIQPWQHGHGETKATCLWLKNLPLLKPSSIVSGRTPRVHHASPGPDRWKERSRTLLGIAKAMAEQWG